MQQISAGHGAPRYTLYFPLQLHRLARPIDVSQLATELGASLSIEVTVSPGRGWEQLRLGPFDTEQQAKDAFHRTTRSLATLCVERQYPIYFRQELIPLQAPWAPLLVADEKVDAIAHSAYPVIVPEHQKIFDSGVMLAQIEPQMTPEQLSSSLHKAAGLASPLSEKLAVAFEAYVIACASLAPMMKFLGFVVALEALCQEEERSESEIFALIDIEQSLKATGIAAKSQLHAAMYDVAKQAIAQRRQISITEQMKRLIAAHAHTIQQNLPGDHPWLLNLSKATGQLYKIRSNIVHRGAWGEDPNTQHRAMQFATAAAKAVLMDKLSSG